MLLQMIRIMSLQSGRARNSEVTGQNLFSAIKRIEMEIKHGMHFISQINRELIKNLATLFSLVLDVSWLSFSVWSVSSRHSSRTVQLN